MKILQKMAIGSDWGRFVWKDIPEGYKSNEDLDTQKSEYQNLWNKTKKKLDTLSDEIALNGVSFEKKGFDPEGKILISTQLAAMLGETGSWSNMKDYPQTKFVMKKLTEMGLTINNPRDFIGKILSIQNGVIFIDGVGMSTEKEVQKETQESTEVELHSVELGEQNIQAVSDEPDQSIKETKKESLTSFENLSPKKASASLSRSLYAQNIFEKIAETTNFEEKNIFMREAIRATAWGNVGKALKIRNKNIGMNIFMFPKKEDVTKTIVSIGNQKYEFSAEELTGTWVSKYTDEQLKLNAVEVQTEKVEGLSKKENQNLEDLKKVKKDAEERLKNLPKEKEEREYLIKTMKEQLEKESLTEVQRKILLDKIYTQEKLLADINSGMHEKNLPKAIDSYQKRIEEIEKLISQGKESHSEEKTLETKKKGKDIEKKLKNLPKEKQEREEKIRLMENHLKEGALTQVQKEILENKIRSKKEEGRNIDPKIYKQSVPKEIDSSSQVEKEREIVENPLSKEMRVVHDFWNLEGVSGIVEKAHKLSQAIKNMAVDTENGETGILFQKGKIEQFLKIENAENILESLKQIDSKGLGNIENYWENMARLVYARKESGKKFENYDQLFSDLPEDIHFEGITKKGNHLSFKKGGIRIDVKFDPENGTYEIVDISKRTGLARVLIFAEKTKKVFTHEELVKLLKQDALLSDIKIEESK